MKRFSYIFYFIALFFLCGCSVNEPETHRILIRFALPGSEPETRLFYEKTEIEGREAIMTKWSEGDVIALSPNPGISGKTTLFELVDGVGTTSGVFAYDTDSYNSGGWSSSLWTVYYPGDKIQSDYDFFNFSYSGQIQKGNGNIDHISDYHTLMVRAAELGHNVGFSEDMVDITAENVEESSCMKLKLENLPEIIPVEVSLSYITPNQGITPFFYIYNRAGSWWTSDYPPKDDKTETMILKLEDFEATSDITAYMMLSNGPLYVKSGGSFRIVVTASDSTSYECRKRINRDAELKGGRLHSITASAWSLVGEESGGDDPGELPDDVPEGKAFLLQEAKVKKGADIVLMGDGFNIYDFGGDNFYRQTILEAYEDIFSVEPFASLRDYFNVYYINAVSADRHDALPYYDVYGNQNGATNGVASTIFKTQFRPGQTYISGDSNGILDFAAQAIRKKGGCGGTECSENEAISRAHKALTIVMVNVPCYAGTCLMAWAGSDYGNAYSIAYVPLCNYPMQRKWTLIHEACGHGFGKLADEYGRDYIGGFDTGVWQNLRDTHGAGINRNVNEYWTEIEMKDGWSFSWEETTEENVYWSDLLKPEYDYRQSEGLGMFRGGYTYANLFCRSTENSVMRHQFDHNGQYFNAISRWTIWFRLMRLTGETSAPDFHSTLDDFLTFDENIVIDYSPESKSGYVESYHEPLAAPVYIKGHWEGPEFVPDVTLGCF